MDKSPDAFRTISEVAEHLDTPAHVLRFWESRFPQIRPVKRAGGRRYYRPSDVSLLTGIKRLLHDEGMTIRGVQKILREQGVRHVAALSGDTLSGDTLTDDQSPFVAEEADVVVPLRFEPVEFRPAPGLADAMAKVMSQGLAAARPAAPSTPLASNEPAQGALLLTPAPQDGAASVTGTAQSSGESLAKAAIDRDIAALVEADRNATNPLPKLHQPEADLFSEPIGIAGELDDDDFEVGATATLASRIRSLPPGATAARIGTDLPGVAARLQALRDRMADAARSSQV